MTSFILKWDLRDIYMYMHYHPYNQVYTILLNNEYSEFNECVFIYFVL